MATSMHRLQISLPHWQLDYLAERARRDGVSIAEVIRRLVNREAERTQSGLDSIWEIAGMAEDRHPLVAEVPVSERPDLYVAALAMPRVRRRARGSRRRSG